MALQQGPCYCQLSCHDNHTPEFLRDSTVSNNISQQILIFSHPEKVPNCFARPSTTHSRDTNVLCQIMCLELVWKTCASNISFLRPILDTFLLSLHCDRCCEPGGKEETWRAIVTAQCVLRHHLKGMCGISREHRFGERVC